MAVPLFISWVYVQINQLMFNSSSTMKITSRNPRSISHFRVKAIDLEALLQDPQVPVPRLLLPRTQHPLRLLLRLRPQLRHRSIPHSPLSPSGSSLRMALVSQLDSTQLTPLGTFTVSSKALVRIAMTDPGFWRPRFQTKTTLISLYNLVMLLSLSVVGLLFRSGLDLYQRTCDGMALQHEA